MTSCESGLSSDTARVIEPSRASLQTLRTPLTAGECRVLDFFDAELPAGWEIYVQPFLNGTRPDFVLLHPHVGIGVFEVKDLSLKALNYRSAIGDNDAYLEVTDAAGTPFRLRSPLDKARHYRERVTSLYVPGLGGRIAAVTAGVIFTTCTTRQARTLVGLSAEPDEVGGRARYETVAGVDALDRGGLTTVFPDAQRRSSQHMTAALADELRDWLREPDHARDQRQPLSLDREQRQLATSRTASGYRRIRGPAGSGKSSVLAARAAQLVSEGKEVLVVSYNHTLRTYLGDLVVRAGGKRSAIRWFGFHEWCKDTMYEAGRKARYEALTAGLAHGDKGVLREAMAHATLDALKSGPTAENVELVDAVLVDEGQDFRLSWWTALRAAVKPEGEMLLVADRAQDLYGNGQAWTEDRMLGAGFAGNWAELKLSYRMPPSLTRLIRKWHEDYLGDDGSSLPPEPYEQEQLELVTLRWVQVAPESVAGVAVAESQDLVRGSTWSDLCIVATTKELGIEIRDALERLGVSTIHTFGQDWREEQRLKHYFFRGDGRVKVTTVHSFKGWEVSRLVVAIDHRHDEVIYTALSRLAATDLGAALTVVCSVDEYEAFGRLWPFATR